MQVALAVSPVIVILLLMTLARRSADIAGLLGWIYTVLIAVFAFSTSWEVVLIASLAGIVASFPISLMVVASIFQINVMEEAGAIRRLVVFMRTLASENRAVQIMLINVGAGTLLAALGATPVSILPPIMLSLGYSAFIAVALPAIGYDALCTYALLRVPVVVFATWPAACWASP
jgi:lactate permease